MDRSEFWSKLPGGARISQGLCRRLAESCPDYFSSRLRNPIFIVGFNNGGKSTLVRRLRRATELCIYPDEGNSELWFRGFFPWLAAQPDVAPIWHDPAAFTAAVIDSRQSDFRLSRAHLGAYQALFGASSIVNDSGMLGALLPDILPAFQDAKFIHVIRNGRVASYLSARREWCNMMRSPAPYQEKGCSLDFQDVLSRMIQYWAWTVRRVNCVAEIYPDRVYELRYENWCEHPDEVFLEVLHFLGVSGKRGVRCEPGAIVNMNDVVTADFRDEEIRTFNNAAYDFLSGLGY